MYIDLFRERFLRLEGDPGGGGGGGGGGGVPPAPADWYEGLSEDLKGDTTVATYKGKPVADVVTALRDLSKSAAENAPPASPQEYKVNIPRRPDGSVPDPKGLEEFFGAAHAAKLSGSQLQNLLDWGADKAKADFEASSKAYAQAEKALKENWGDAYPENLRLAEKVVSGLPEGLLKIIEFAGIGSHPHLIELFHTIGEARSEGRLHRGDPVGQPMDLATKLYGST